MCFSFVYYLLAFILHILFIPFLLYKGSKKKYEQAIPAKFFLKNNPKFKKNKIWFHSCSMGETRALKPLIASFEKDEINISVITNTGYEEAKKYNVDVRYLPFETLLPFWITKQKVLVVMEAELWYLLFLLAKQNATKTILINARVSDKSYKSYKKFSWFYSKIFKNIDKVFAQSEIDKQRLKELGAKNIEVIGNIKLANLPKVTKEYNKQDEVLITAASTHESEEELILNAWDKSMGKLIVVPRHPERFEVVDKIIQAYLAHHNKEIKYHKWSDKKDFTSDIILVDVLGELNNIYNISDLVILGGSFISSAGGHNPIEPAFFNTKLISGKTIFNQKSLFECVQNTYFVDNDKLKEQLDKIDTLERSKLDKSADINKIRTYIKENTNG